MVIKMVMLRHMELNRYLKKVLLQRKEMTHENINRFIGAGFETPLAFIVSELCSRRSLQVQQW